MSNLETEDPAANSGAWTEVPRQLKQKRCHQCSKRTFYWLFEAAGAVCKVCVNLRTMPKPIPQTVSVGESTNGKKQIHDCAHNQECHPCEESLRAV